jgi:biopolymer transport protein ExbB
MEDILRDGGTVGWIIIVLSVATVALIIECGVNIRRDKICRPELIDEIEALLEEDEVQEAMELCESEPNFFTNMMAAGLSRANFGYDDIKTSIENRGAVEVTKLQQKVGWILWLSNIGPLLGLFGTVVGMIVAFKTIKALGAAVTPTDLATGFHRARDDVRRPLVVSIPVTAYQPSDKVTKTPSTSRRRRGHDPTLPEVIDRSSGRPARPPVGPPADERDPCPSSSRETRAS